MPPGRCAWGAMSCMHQALLQCSKSRPGSKSMPGSNRMPGRRILLLPFLPLLHNARCGDAAALPHSSSHRRHHSTECACTRMPQLRSRAPNRAINGDLWGQPHAVLRPASVTPSPRLPIMCVLPAIRHPRLLADEHSLRAACQCCAPARATRTP
eukprot:363781-Chlamydomonas_euryale.AAC.19